MTEAEDTAPAPNGTPEADAGEQNPSPEPERAAEDKEAAKYRRRLREAEKERDTLQSRLETLQRSEVERLAADKLADPADVWRDGADLSGLLDDSGNIDAEKVGGLVDGLLEAHAHWATPQPQSPKRGGFQSGASAPPSVPKETTWAGALKGSEHR